MKQERHSQRFTTHWEELATRHIWKTKWLAFGFWSINLGLALMVLLSNLPRGLMQTWASVEHGMWYARSAEFTQTNVMDTLRWLRVIGDTIFAIGVLALGWFVLGLKTGWSVTGRIESAMVPNEMDFLSVNPDLETKRPLSSEERP